MKKIISAIILSFLVISPITANAAHFPDVPKSHWAYHSIHSLSDKKIVTGYSNGSFKPGVDITRAQAALVLSRALKLDTNVAYKPKFKDVPTDHYAYKAIRALTAKGVFSDVSHFNPDQPLTRSQMAKILIKGFGIKVDDNHQESFQDIPKNHWAHGFIITLAEVGISYGVTPSTFQPDTTVTRAQLAAFTDRALTFDSRITAKSITYDAKTKKYSGLQTIAYDTIALLNKERANAGLKAVKEDPVLSKIAQLKAEDMVKNDYFDHVSPTYGKPWEMAVHFGYPTNQVGENIALGYVAPKEVMVAWMDSPGHKANVLRAPYTVIGVGYAKDEDGIPYWVHMFAIK